MGMGTSWLDFTWLGVYGYSPAPPPNHALYSAVHLRLLEEPSFDEKLDSSPPSNRTTRKKVAGKKRHFLIHEVLSLGLHSFFILHFHLAPEVSDLSSFISGRCGALSLDPCSETSHRGKRVSFMSTSYP
mgnify:CR=1 FL=1